MFLNEQYPRFGASPDGLITCKCCGDGCLEVKCPSSAEGGKPINMPYLEMEGDEIRLSRKHKHYYQVQVQMFITRRNYCDFVVWSKKKIIVERIVKDHALWDDISVRAVEFHRKCVMPEMAFKFFSNQKKNTSFNGNSNFSGANAFSNVDDAHCDNTDSFGNVVYGSTVTIGNDENVSGSDLVADEIREVYCVCRCPDDGSKMIECANKTCDMKWFHFRCVNLKRAPKGDWFCLKCKKC